MDHCNLWGNDQSQSLMGSEFWLMRSEFLNSQSLTHLWRKDTLRGGREWIICWFKDMYVQWCWHSAGTWRLNTVIWTAWEVENCSVGALCDSMLETVAVYLSATFLHRIKSCIFCVPLENLCFFFQYISEIIVHTVVDLEGARDALPIQLFHFYAVFRKIMPKKLSAFRGWAFLLEILDPPLIMFYF